MVNLYAEPLDLGVNSVAEMSCFCRRYVRTRKDLQDIVPKWELNGMDINILWFALDRHCALWYPFDSEKKEAGRSFRGRDTV